MLKLPTLGLSGHTKFQKTKVSDAVKLQYGQFQHLAGGYLNYHIRNPDLTPY